MEILFFLAGVLITWLVMSGLLTQACALLYRIWWPSSKRAREYKNDQWLCNIPDNPSSSWNILGYWRETSGYQQACSEMAGLLADKACLSAKDDVLDVGFTSHDQLQVWMEYYQVNSLTALAKDEQQLASASRTCARFDTLKLLRGGESALTHLESDQFDKVLALDCVYRFADKPLFFSHSRKVIKPGGALAFTDMVLARPYKDAREQKLVETLGRIAGIRTDAMSVQGDYGNILAGHGFEKVEVTDITEDVLSGFCFWFSQHHQKLSLYTRSKLWIRLRLLVWFIRWMQYRGQLEYQLVFAR